MQLAKAFMLILCLTSCRHQDARNDLSTVEGIHKSKEPFTFYTEGSSFYAVTNLRTSIYDLTYVVVTRYNPTVVYEGVYGFRSETFPPMGYEDALKACSELKWIGLKWRLPNEDEARHLTTIGIKNITDEDFLKHRLDLWVNSKRENAHTWFYDGDPTVNNTFKGDPNARVLTAEKISWQIADTWQTDTVSLQQKLNYMCVSYMTTATQNLNDPIPDDFDKLPADFKRNLDAHLFLHKEVRENHPTAYSYLSTLKELDTLNYNVQATFHNKSIQRRNNAAGFGDVMITSSAEQKERDQAYDVAVKAEHAAHVKFDATWQQVSAKEKRLTFDLFQEFLVKKGTTFKVFKEENLSFNNWTISYLSRVEPK